MFELIGTLEASSPAKGLARTAASVHIEGAQKVTFADNLLPQLEAIARRAVEPRLGIDGVALINDGEAEAGCFATVEIAEAHPYDLVGRVLETELSGAPIPG